MNRNQWKRPIAAPIPARRAARAAGVLRLTAVAMMLASPSLHAADSGSQNTVRPAVGQPLQLAQKLIEQKKYPEALVKIDAADKVKDKTPYEVVVIGEMRGYAEKGAGDKAAAIKSFETIVASEHISATDRSRFTAEIAADYYDSKDYPNAITWALRHMKGGGNDGETHTLLAQSYYLSLNYADAAAELQGQIQAAEQANRLPPENQLVMLADCDLKQKNEAAYAADLERLISAYPKSDYWALLLNHIARSPRFASRLQIDLDRLRLATGTLSKPNDYVEMVQLALAAGSPGEAQKAVEQGYSAGILGTGADAERHTRLGNLVRKSVAEDQKTLGQSAADAAKQQDGTGLVNTGLDYVGYGQADSGIALIEQGVRKGGLKHPEDAKLRLGAADLFAGRTAAAVTVLQTVGGTDGTADLARAWLLYAKHAAPVVAGAFKASDGGSAQSVTPPGQAAAASLPGR